MAIAKGFKSTPTIEEVSDGIKSSDDRWFRLDRAFYGRHIADADQSIPYERSGFPQLGEYRPEQRRQSHLFDLRLPTTARADLALTKLQFGQHRLDVGMVLTV